MKVNSFKHKYKVTLCYHYYHFLEFFVSLKLLSLFKLVIFSILSYMTRLLLYIIMMKEFNHYGHLILKTRVFSCLLEQPAFRRISEFINLLGIQAIRRCQGLRRIFDISLFYTARSPVY